MGKASFLSEIAKSCPNLTVLLDEPMFKHTTFKIGGPADIFVVPKKTEDIVKVVLLAKEHQLPLTVIGNGSNILVKDKGIRGIVLVLGNGLMDIEVSENSLSCGAGVLLSSAANKATENSFTGMEFAAGIPGSVGGGVFMNAGAYDGELKDILQSVEAVTLDGKVYNASLEEAKLSYRHSAFTDNGHIITKATFKLLQGDKKAIREKILDFNQRRCSKQPLELPSAGSTFKRPQGSYASKLIDEAGLMGLMVGGAQVSEKHAGFVVNKNKATADDVLRLIEEVQKRVKTLFDIELQPEVKIIGE